MLDSSKQNTVLGGDNTLYLCAPADEQERLAPLFVTLIAEIRAEVYRRAALSGAAVDPALLIVLDEAANVAPVPDLDVLASTGAGQGLQLVTIVQDLAQVHKRWPTAAETIVNNHAAKVLGSGSAARARSTTSPGSSATRRSARCRPRARRAGRASARARERAARERAGDGSAGLPQPRAARLELRPWFRERGLRELVDRPQAAGDEARVA